jgi:hypothetical protein
MGPTNPLQLQALVDGTLGTIQVNAPSTFFPVGSNFRINMVKDTENLNTILAQSPQFDIVAAPAASSVAHTSTTGSVLFYVIGIRFFTLTDRPALPSLSLLRPLGPRPQGRALLLPTAPTPRSTHRRLLLTALSANHLVFPPSVWPFSVLLPSLFERASFLLLFMLVRR